MVPATHGVGRSESVWARFDRPHPANRPTLTALADANRRPGVKL